ncbi:MAG: isochorismatase family protein [Deferribacteraceae bacterium]|jgi:nicotinamidase-related amidase|nr:isochorismatase family protein [Deferribacteraceae bacterium]
MKRALLIVDPQNDFVLPSGSLAVKGAVEDMDRLSDIVKRRGLEIDKIIITLDSHHPIHIASPIYWEDEEGNLPPPFTLITSGSKWIPRFHKEKAFEYLEQIEQKGKKLIIWPPHTLFGSSGWAVYEPLFNAVNDWVLKTGRDLATCPKGSNPLTEMFSAVKPEVSFDEEKDNAAAEQFLNQLEGFDAIWVAGEAENFCVKETVEDILELRADIGAKIEILKGCTSSI